MNPSKKDKRRIAADRKAWARAWEIDLQPWMFGQGFAWPRPPAPSLPPFDLVGHELTFEEPDTDSFRCLALARQAGRDGGTAPAVLNAANEVAVEAFLSGQATFLDIAALVEDEHPNIIILVINSGGGAQATLRGGSFTARGGEEAYGLKNDGR